MLRGKTAPGATGDACVQRNSRASRRERDSKAHVQDSLHPPGRYSVEETPLNKYLVFGRLASLSTSEVK